MEEVVALEQAVVGLPLVGSFTAPECNIGVTVGVDACREDEVLDSLPLLGMQCSITGPVWDDHIP